MFYVLLMHREVFKSYKTLKINHKKRTLDQFNAWGVLMVNLMLVVS